VKWGERAGSAGCAAGVVSVSMESC